MTVLDLELVSLEEWQSEQLADEESILDLDERRHEWTEDEQ